jgi:hypothetical protein
VSPRAERILEWASRQEDIASAVMSVSDEFAGRKAPLLYVEDRLRVPGSSPRTLTFVLRQIANRKVAEATLRFDLEPIGGTVSATVTGVVNLRRKTLLDGYIRIWAERVARDAMLVALRIKSR